MMLDHHSLDALADRLAQALPPGMTQLRRELQDNFRVMLGAHLEKLDLVTRERFDVQAELLSRTQARLKALEARLASLEQHNAARR